MYQVNIKKVSEKTSRDLNSYVYLAEVFENGERVEDAKFYGAQVPGGILQISMLRGNAVGPSATRVHGDMIDAFAKMQSGEDGEASVVSKDSPWSGTITFDGDE